MKSFTCFEMLNELEGGILPTGEPQQAKRCFVSLMCWEHMHDRMIDHLIKCGDSDSGGKVHEVDELGGYCRAHLYEVYVAIGEALKRWEENGLDR